MLQSSGLSDVRSERSDVHTTEWTTSEPVQIITGLGTLVAAIAPVAVAAIAAGRVLRRRRFPR